jgi:hypothetical protein
LPASSKQAFEILPAHQKKCLLAYASDGEKRPLPGFRPGPRTLAMPANAKTCKHTERKAMSTAKAWMMFATCTKQQTATNNNIAANTTAPPQQQQTNHHTAHA